MGEFIIGVFNTSVVMGLSIAAAYGAVGMADGDMQSMQNQPGQNQAIQKSPSQISGQGTSKKELTMADVLFAVWICVAVLLAAWFVAGYWRMRGRIRRRSSECGDGHVQQAIAEVAAECKLKRIPEVRIMRDSEEGPFATGC